METLSEIMKRLGLKDGDLAKDVRCGRPMISKIRTGRATPSLKLAIALVERTGVDIKQLLPEQQQ